MNCENDMVECKKNHGVVNNFYQCSCSCKSEGTITENETPIGDKVSTGNIGEIFWWPLVTPPDDALYCDGSEVSREDYADLFNVISINFGDGDGSETFNLPDLRGEFIRGYDAENQRDPQGSTRDIGTHQDDALQNIAGSFDAYSYNTGAGTGIVASSVNTPNAVQGGNSPQLNYVRYSIDSSRIVRTDVETRPKNISLLPCIRYKYL